MMHPYPADVAPPASQASFKQEREPYGVLSSTQATVHMRWRRKRWGPYSITKP